MGSFTSKGLDIGKEDIINALGKPPPDNLAPIGDSGIYISPHVKEDKPVSPFDCEAWPDSPYCGGNPWTRTPAGFEDIEFGVSECGISITGTPVLAWTKMPPISVGWIAPECRAEYGQRKTNKVPPVDSPEAPPPLQLPTNIDPETSATVVIVCTGNSEFLRKADQFGVYEISTGSSTTSVRLDMSGFYNPYESLPTGGQLAGYVLCSIYVEGNKTSSQEIRGQQPRNSVVSYKPIPGRLYGDGRNKVQNRDYSAIRASFSSFANFPHAFLLQGRYGDIYKDYNGLAFFSRSDANDQTYWTRRQYDVAYLITDKSGPPTPNDDYKKRDCCMQCCQGSQAQERRRDEDNQEILALLREIRKVLGPFPVKVNIFDANESAVGAQSKVESISTVAQGFFRAIAEIEKALKCIGIDQLPIFTPSSIIDDESNGILGDLGDLKNQIFKQRIESLAELALWDIKNKYEIFGKWQESITIEDSDPTKKGNQPKKIVLPNMARTFRELMLLNSIQVKTLGMLFDVSLKMYIDLANTKISASVSEAILRDIQDYLDYPTEIKKLDVPLGISIPSDNTPNDDREDLERFLRNSTAKAKFDDWTGEGSMTEMLITLLRAAESIIGQNYERLQ